jgi:hypothetical protein
MKQFDAPKRKKKCEGTDPDDSDEEVADLQFALEELEEEVEDNDTDEESMAGSSIFDLNSLRARLRSWRKL